MTKSLSIIAVRTDKGKGFYAYYDQQRSDTKKLEPVKKINLTRANAKALGMLDGNDAKLDGYILMRNLTDLSLDWNYDVHAPNLPDNSLDFLSVALHEVGHTLGFISGVDDPTWLGIVLEGNESGKELKKDKMKAATLLDLFRLSDKSVSDFGGVPDLTISGGNKFFSIDGGETNLAAFANGEAVNLGADGYQASHWRQQNTPLGIMDPTLTVGQRRTISDLDKLALDVIGWDLLSSAPPDLAVLNALARENLAQKMGVTPEWMSANPTAAAERLAPIWLNTDGDKYDDRGELLQEMIKSSKVYKSDKDGYWWGWGGYWWGWGGYWQERDDVDEAAGLWQHMVWQTVESPITDAQKAAASVPEPAANTGLLGLAGLGLGGLLQGWRKKVSATRRC